MRLGMLTSVCGFASLLPSGFPGLAQLGVYSISGLIAAAAVTRFVLPELLPRRFAIRDLAPLGARITAWMEPARRARARVPWAFALALAGIALGVLMLGARNALEPGTLALEPGLARAATHRCRVARRPGRARLARPRGRIRRKSRGGAARCRAHGAHARAVDGCACDRRRRLAVQLSAESRDAGRAARQLAARRAAAR